MIFRDTPIPGAYVIEPVPLMDERGWFSRTFCAIEFEKQGLNPRLAQCSISYNHRRGTLRGLHYQVSPYAETKLVRCVAGAIFDVAVDLRQDSATFGRWFAVELNAVNRWALSIPEGCAHGFQTLVDASEVFYQISEFYQMPAARGVRWNDPELAISWPIEEVIISARDREWPVLADLRGDEADRQFIQGNRFLPD